MRIAICDDEDEWINKIEDHLIKFKQTHKNITWEVFYSGEEVVEHYKTYGNVFDVLITDIEMNGINGIELANKIREIDTEISIFFLSDNEAYMRDCFAARPVNFWNKPIAYDHFAQDIEKVISLQKTNHKFFSLMENRVYKRIPYNEIIYFMNKGRKIVVHTAKKEYEFYGKFKDYLDDWGKNNFYVISRFVCVNENYIMSLKNNVLFLKDGRELEVSSTEIKKIKHLFFENNGEYIQQEKKARIKK